MLEVEELFEGSAKIKVVGVGGGGGNAVNTMLSSKLEGVEFIVANTDMQALNRSLAMAKLQIGGKITRGLGSGGDPVVGRNAAMEDTDKIRKYLEGSDLVFVTAGMGGGTGSGAAAIVAGIAKEIGALTVGVVTKPFVFEGSRRLRNAESAISELKKVVDSIIVIPNQRILNVADRKTPLQEAFKMADDVLRQAVRGISDLIMIPGLVNLDFADVKSVMSGTGRAVMGTGCASGENRAIEAAQRAISSPLLDDGSIEGARGILINITGGEDLALQEINDALSIIHEAADAEANIIFGAVINPSMTDNVEITVIATGFNDAREASMPVRHDREILEAMPKSIPKIVGKAQPHLIRKTGTGGFDFNQIDLGIDDDEFDVPTFLRRQAD